MTLLRFTKGDFQEYNAWFVDHELCRRLGPMDQEWLDHVLGSSSGDQYTAWSHGDMVGVVGVVLPSEVYKHYVISDIAVRPDLRGQGIGNAILDLIVQQYRQDGIQSWVAYLDYDNQAAQGLFNSCGWDTATQEASDDMITMTKCVVN